MSTSGQPALTDTSAVLDFFPPGQRARILEHMNEDHADAVLGYARHHGGRAAATGARLTGIDRAGIELAVIEPEGERPLRIAFEQPLESPDDAHLVLVAMARAAKSPGDAGLARARAAVTELRDNLKTLILGTASAAGEPDASVAPAVLSDGGVLHTYVSGLSAHTQNLRESGRASVLLIEDESAAGHLLARKRLTLFCAATFVGRDTPEFTAAMAALKEKFGLVMQHLESMIDFQLVRLVPARGRLVAGFGQAYDVDPADWTRLSHVGGSQGHGHTPRN